MILRRCFIILFLLLVASGCASNGLLKAGETEPSIAHPAMDAGLYEGPSVVAHQGNAVYTWYDPKRRLMMASREGVLSVSDGTPSPSLLSFNVLHSDGHALYFVFRPKGEDKGWKYTLFRASYDGGKTLANPLILNRDHGAMEPVIAANGKGAVYVAWYDERDGKFDIYMNVSHDYGKTWLNEDVRMNIEQKPGKVSSISPQIFASEDNAWAIWLDSGRKTERRLMMRSSIDAGRSWSEPRAVSEGENFYDPRIFIANGRVMILWCSSKGFQYLAKGIYSDDLGKTWQPAGEIKVNSFMQFEINASADTSGNVYMAIAVRDKYKIGIDNIYFVMSPDRGQTWSEPVRIQTNPPHHTFANIPQIASDNSGRIMVTWADYRNIRGNIYVNMSKDFGKTWLKEEVLLSKVNHNANLPRIAASGDGRFYVIWLEYNDDLMQKAFVTFREVTLK